MNLYERLFNNENLGENYLNNLNPNSLKRIKNAKAELSLKNANPNIYYQFLRTGYFKLDKQSNNDRLIFNRSVSLRDTWSKKK